MREHDGAVQVRVEVSSSTLEHQKCRDVDTNNVARYKIFHVGKIML